LVVAPTWKIVLKTSVAHALRLIVAEVNWGMSSSWSLELAARVAGGRRRYDVYMEAGL
jgi:hypothetical protein